MESEVDHELSFQFGDISEEIADIENSQVERETRQFFDLELIEPTKKAESNDNYEDNIPIEVFKV